jgi:hypothetical protein
MARVNLSQGGSVGVLAEGAAAAVPSMFSEHLVV